MINHKGRRMAKKDGEDSGPLHMSPVTVQSSVIGTNFVVYSYGRSVIHMAGRP